LIEIGLDSMLASKLVMKLEDALRRKVPIAVILAGASIEDIAAALGDPDVSSPATHVIVRDSGAPITSLEDLLASIDALSDEAEGTLLTDDSCG